MTNVDKTSGQPRVQQTTSAKKVQKTKKQINQVVNAILEFVPNDAAAKSRITRIAQELNEYADAHNGAVGQEGFTKLMKEITPENVVAVILKYNELFNSSTSTFSDNETLVETILDETASDHEDIREALVGNGTGKNKLRGLFMVLLDRAKQVGMDDATIKSYRQQFKAELDKELGGTAFMRSSSKMDEIINTVIQSIKNHIEENNKAAKANAPQKVVPAKTHQTQATNTIVKRYNKALKDFNQQMKTDGWAEDVADAMGRLWGKNYADAVRKDLKVAKEQVDRLKAALAKGDEAFRAEFLNIFGVSYDSTNISAYQRAEAAYTTALKAKSNEESFKSYFELMLTGKALAAETTSSTTTSIKGDAYTSLKVVKKEEVFEREFNKVAELFDAAVKADKSGQFALLGVTDGKTYVEKAFETAGVKDKSIDEKYKFLQKMVSDISKSLTAETKKACGGRSFDAIQKQYENCYKAAYGLENDILKRVTDYNISQQKGGGAVKGAVVAVAAIGIGVLTAGSGTAAVAGGTGAAAAGGATTATVVSGAIKGAATVAATSAAVEISDRFTSKEALDALRKDGVLAFLEKGCEVTDWKQIATASLVSGAMCLAFAGQSYAITNLTMKVATAAGASAEAAGYTAAALSTAGFVATGLGTEYIFQGEITVEGATFTVIMAFVSGAMQVRQVYKTSEAIKAQTMENIANARKALGFAEDEVINLDKAEKAYKEIAKLHHPNSSARTGDGAMHDAIFAAAQNAIEVLRKNAVNINAVVTQKVASPQASQAQPQANPSHIATPEDGAIVQASHYNVWPVAQPEVFSVTPILVNGVDVQATIADASSKVVATESEVIGTSTTITGKDANGKIVITEVKDGAMSTVHYTNGNNGVTQILVNDKVIANNVTNANGVSVYSDVNGKTLTQNEYNALVDKALAEVKPTQATEIPIQPQVSAMAAAGSGPVAEPSMVTGGAARVSEVESTIANAQASVATTETSTEYGVTTTFGRDAKGNTVTTSVKNGMIEQTSFVDGEIAVSQTSINGKLVGSYIAKPGVEGLYIDAEGNVMTEEAFAQATTNALSDAYNELPPQIDIETQQLMRDGLIRQEYVLEVENALANSNTENVVRNTMLKAKTQAELQYFADKFKNSDSVADRYTALKAEAYKDQLPVKPSEETLGMATGQRLLPEGEAAAAVGKEPAITVPEGTTVEQARAKIAELQQQLKAYGVGLDRYDQIHMDRIQAEIREYRKIAPLDRTNLEEVLQASPSEVFQPITADNIKGQGISFKPNVPTDPEALAKVTYKAVPLYTQARTVEEMIRIAARDGVKIEMVQDADGNYYPGVKSVWSEGGYFKLDRDSYVVQYGEIPADDPYIDQAWAQQNKYTNAEGKEVVMDCAIVAADKKTAADIMPHSYVKASGAPLSASDKHNWGGFQAHKDPDGVVNAVAYDEPQELTTLEGKITTDVTMGDVEGNVYNKYNDLKKQILKDKLVANPDDPNSQKFIDLVKAGKDDEAIALLREVTKASQAEPAPAPEVAPNPQVEGIRTAIAEANDIDALRTLRDQIKGVQDKAVAQELREAYVQKEQALRAALPQEVKDIENMYRPDGSPSAAARERILAKAGFSEAVIDDIVANGPWGDPKIDAELMEEVKNMVIWLEGELENGATLNKALIEEAISRFSPDASGGSSACQRSILANYWTHGQEVYNAYGHKAPGQSTFSWGNLKAKWNHVKNSVKEFYEYKKWELGYDTDAPVSRSVQTDRFAKWDTEKLMNEFNARYNYGIKEDIPDLRAELITRGYAPNENGYFLTNEIVPEGTLSTPAPVVTGGAARTQAPLDEAMRLNLLSALKNTNLKDTRAVTDLMASNPDFVRRLAEVKGPNGKPLFDDVNIDLVLANCKDTIVEVPEKIWTILNNPAEVKDIAGWKNPAAGLWRALHEPLPSTIEANPGIFRMGSSSRSTAAAGNGNDPVSSIKNMSAEERTSILDKAGFNSNTIELLKQRSSFYGYGLVEETLDMIVYLEKEVAKGTPITRTLIENTIDMFSPGASGASASVQRSWIANQWNKGVEVYNAYGEKAPAEVVAKAARAAAGSATVRDEFIQKFDSARSTQDLEAMVEMAETPEECEYVVTKLDNPNTKAVNGYRIQAIIDSANAKMKELQSGGVKPVASSAEMQADIAADAAKVATLDLAKSKNMSFDEFFEQCQAYAKEHNMRVEQDKSGFGSKVLKFVDNTSGRVSREIHYVGEHVFDERYFTYDSNGNLKTENRYMADSGKYADTIEYFYDEQGNRTYSLKFNDDKQIDVAVWKNGKGTRMGQGVFYTADQVKSRFGLDIDRSAFNTKAADAEAKVIGAAAPVTEVSVQQTAPKVTPREALLALDFSETWNPTELQAWADKNNFSLTFTDKNRIAIFKDANGNVVRRVTQDWDNKSKVYDDKRAIYDANGNEVGRLEKYTGSGKVMYIFAKPDGSGKEYAHLNDDGLWCTTELADNDMGGTGMVEVLLETNPITGKPQVQSTTQVTSAPAAPTQVGGAAPVQPMANSVAKCDIPVNMPKRTATMQNVTVTVAGGDMTGIKADAYVVPEFDNCASEGGVGGAVARRGAAGGLKAYDDYVHQNGAQEYGNVVVTESGGGNTSHLIHAVTAGADAENSFEVVQRAVYNSLKAAQAQGMQSVVIPAMGTGIIGTLTNEQSAQAILSGVNQFAQEGGKMDVSVVVYSTGQGLQDFNNTLVSKTYENATPVVGTKEFDQGAWAAEMAETLETAPVSSSDASAAKVVSGTEVPAADVDFASKLADFKDNNGNALLTSKEIDFIIKYFESDYNVTGMGPISNYEAKILAVLNNPEEIANARKITKNNSIAEEIVRAVIKPLESTVEANPGLFSDVPTPPNGPKGGQSVTSAQQTTTQQTSAQTTSPQAPQAVSQDAILAKANHVSEDGPQWLERRLQLHRGEAADMRTVKTLNAQTQDAVRVIYDAKGNEIAREEVYGGDLISTREEFLDSEGRVIKTNLLDRHDGSLYEEYRTEYNGDETITHGKKYDNDGNVKEYYTRTQKGKDTTYIEYDANGNATSKLEVVVKDGAKTTTRMSFKDGVPTRYSTEAEYPDGTSETTFVDHEKNTKVITKKDKDWKVTAISETGVDVEPRFITKSDVLKDNAEVFDQFPVLRDAVAEGNFDCTSTRAIAETIKEKPDAVRAVLELKNPDGTPRFTPNEAGTLILNCRNFLETPRLMAFMTTPEADGTPRKVYDIWRGYIDSDLFKDVTTFETSAPAPAPKAQNTGSTLAQKANHIVENGPQNLEQRIALQDGEAVDMRTSKVENPHTNHTERVTYDANGNEVGREKLLAGKISTYEEFLDADGNVIKTNEISYYDGHLIEEFRTERNGSQVTEHGKRYDSEGNVEEYYTRIRDGKNLTYIEYDANGNTLSKYEKVVKNGTITTTEIAYQNDTPTKTEIEVRYTDNMTSEVTVIDHEKGTKVVSKKDSNYNITAISETGIDEEPRFITKSDVLADNADVFNEFPTLRDAVAEGNFDCSSTKIIAETINEKPDAVRAVLELKNPDGTPRFTPNEAGTLILNCRNFLETPRLMAFMTTPKADGTQREVYEIWRGYLDSDEFADVTEVEAPAQPAPASETPKPQVKVDTRPVEEYPDDVIERVSSQKGVHKVISQETMPNSGRQIEQYVDSNNKLVLTVFTDNKTGKVLSTTENILNEQGFTTKAITTYADGSTMEDTFVGDGEFSKHLTHTEKDAEGKLVKSENYEDNTSIEAASVEASDEPLVIGKPKETPASPVAEMNAHQKAEILDKAFTSNATYADNLTAAEILLQANDAKIVRSEVTENPYKETFYDKDGKVVKTNYLNQEDGSVRTTEVPFAKPQRNGVTEVSKSRYQIEIREKQPWVTTFEGTLQQFDRSYREFTLEGKPIRDVYATDGAYDRIPDSYEIRYDKDGKPISVKQEIHAKDGSKVTTFIDYEKGTKRIEKTDKNWKIYEVSETGINDAPEFITKQDVIRRSADAWAGFPTMRQAVSDADFDCVSVQTIVETLRKNPEACDKIIKLKNADGTPRFAPEDAATLILNCSKFIDSPRLMKFITTPKADGTPREVYEIWRGYVDSDEFKDAAPTPAAPAETETSPVDTMVLESMAKPEVKSYIERIVNTKGDTDALKEIYHEFDNMPDTPENKALVSGIVKCFMSGGQNTEHVADFVKTELTKIHTEEVAKEAALASINKDAVLSDEVYAAAFELSPQVSATDKRHVADLMKANAGIVEKMMTYKNPDGSLMFPPKTVAEFFLNCESVITSDPGRIFTTIESDLFQKTYADWENKSAALWKCLYY